MKRLVKSSPIVGIKIQRNFCFSILVETRRWRQCYQRNVRKTVFRKKLARFIAELNFFPFDKTHYLFKINRFTNIYKIGTWKINLLTAPVN